MPDYFRSFHKFPGWGGCSKNQPRYLTQGDSIAETRPKRLRRAKRETRARLYASSPYCFYCNAYLELDDSTVDHVVPRSKGGTNTFDNMVLSCWPCNEFKKDYVVVIQNGIVAVPLRTGTWLVLQLEERSNGR